MVDSKEIERECFEFLKTKFDKVIWLSEKKVVPIDFKCHLGGNEFLIDAKYSKNFKVMLYPNQWDADAVVISNGKEIKLIWKKDFYPFVSFSKSSVIKIETDLKTKLDKIKIHWREPYNEIIEKLYNYYKKRESDEDALHNPN